MDDRFNMLSGVVLDSPLDQCSLDELEELTRKYPYFSAAHFLLLRKKQLEDVEHAATIQKAMLYYHHPVAFTHFMNPLKTDEKILAEPEKPQQPLIPPFQEEAAQDHTLVSVPQPLEPPPPVPEPETMQVDQPVGTPNEVSLAASPEKEKSTESGLSFEPYHTVDYFASQGIRPSKEEPKDALGKQLKSFTEWLKTMKKLPDAAAAISQADPKVDSLASRSVGDPHVVTEAMAEVWLKQGNKERAREIYEKLSLSDPSKKAYFAAKIDNLNAD